MFSFFKKYNLEQWLSFFEKILIFILPWQTIYIISEEMLKEVKWEYATLGFYFTEIILWITVFLFIAWFYFTRIKKTKRSLKFVLSKDRILAISFLFLMLYAMASAFWSINSAMAYQHSLYLNEAILFFFILIAGPLHFRDFAKWFIAGVTIQSLIGIYQFLFQASFELKFLGLVEHNPWIPGASIVASADIGRWLRAYGGFSHPNIFAGYLVVSLLFTHILYREKLGVCGRGLGKVFRLVGFVRENQCEIRASISYLVIYSIQLSALFFTFSRSGWIAFVAVLAFLYTLESRKKRDEKMSPSVHLTYTLLLVVTLALLYFPIVQTRLTGQSVNEIMSTTERVSGLQESWEVFKSRPLLGAGIGNYTAAAYELNSDRPGWTYQPVHNVPMLVLSELGIIGSVLAVFVIFMVFYFLLALAKNFSPITLKGVLSFIFICLAYIILSSLDHYLFSSYSGLMLCAVFWGGLSRFLPQSLHK